MKILYKALLVNLTALCFCITLHAQNGNSNTEGISRLNIDDTTRIKQVLEQALHQVDNNTDSAIIVLEKVLSWSKQHQYNDGIALATMGISSAYAVRNDKVKARAYLYAAKAYCLASTQKDRMMVKWYRNQFLTYRYVGQTDSALIALQQAIPLLDKVGDTALSVNNYNLFGTALIDNQNYNDALPYIKKAIALNPGQNSDLLVSYINLCYVLDNNGNSKDMLQWATKAYTLSRQLHLPKYERSASLMLTKSYLGMGEKEKAAAYAQNAIRLIDKTVSDNHLYVYRLLSSFYISYADYEQALNYGNIALSKIKETQKQRRDVVDLHLKMAKIHAALGHHKQAYGYLLEYLNLSDSINLLERDKAVDKLEQQFRLSEKEKEIVLKENQILLQQSKVKSRNFWIMGISLGLISLVALMFIYYRNSERKIYLLRHKKEIDKLEAMMEGEEKERNRIAIELHDHIGGMLSAATYSLSAFTDANKQMAEQNAFKKVEFIIAEVRSEIRKTAHTLMPDVLLRHSLFEAIQQYCSFIERETGVQLDVQQQGNFDELSKDVQLSLYRICQELIQNVLKHAKATQVMVQLHASKALVSLTVEDNGTGFSADYNKQGRGLLHIQNRLLLIQGKISIDSETGKGSSIYVEVNY